MTNPQTRYYQNLSIVKLRHQMKQRGLDVSSINHSDEDKERAVQCLLNDDRRIVAAEVHAMTDRRLAKVRAIEQAKQTEEARQSAETAARKALADAVAHEAEVRARRETEEAELQARKEAEAAALLAAENARKEAQEAALLAKQDLRLRRTQLLNAVRSQLVFDDCLQIMLPPKALPGYRAMKARVLKATGPEDKIIEEIDQFLNDFVTRDFLAGCRCIGGPPEWTVREFERLNRERRGLR